MRHELERLAREAVYRSRYLINAYPSVYGPLGRFRHRDQDDWSVSRDTELVIEGFGRSGSTFAVDAFELAQSQPVRLAHHTHAAAQVITAARWKIPMLLIIRRPVEVVPSHMARRDIGPRPPLIAWTRFHERVLPYRDDFVVAPFEEIITDLGAAIRRLNHRFGTCFEVFEHSAGSEASVFDRIEARNLRRFGVGSAEGQRSLARPTAERDARKEALRAAYEAPGLAALRARAERAYRTLWPPTQED